MNILKITLNEDGDIVNYDQDFLIFRGGYGDITMQVEVPHSLLLDPVTDIGGKSTTTGNNVKVGAIIRTSTGENIKTRSYEFKRVKDFKIKEINYRLYQRPLPKEFTLWETVSFIEETTPGTLEMVLNVSNWTTNEFGAKVEENRATHIITVDVHPSTNLDESEKIDNPSDLELLQSQVQNIDKSLQDVEKDLYSINENGLGEYLLKRLIAGDKISIEKDTSKSPTGLIISLIPMQAKEVSIDSIKDIKSNNVQDALEELSKRTDSVHVDTISAISDDMLDNTDPNNPIILHDPSKADKDTFEAKTAQIDSNLYKLQNNKADLVDGKIPSSQLPSYVDDVLEYPTFSQLPDVGEDGKIYVTLDTNLTYRWGGTEYIEISPSLALGETASTAYRGDRGKIAYDHSQTNGNPHNTKLSEVIEDATHRTVTDIEKQQWNQAEKNVQSDWNEDNPTSSSYILNKPNIPAGVQLYDTTGQNTNGSMTQKATTDEFKKYLSLTGGKMSGTIEMTSTGITNPIFRIPYSSNGNRIIEYSINNVGNPLFYIDPILEEIVLGLEYGNYKMVFSGTKTRPYYLKNNKETEIALISDVGTVVSIDGVKKTTISLDDYIKDNKGTITDYTDTSHTNSFDLLYKGGVYSYFDSPTALPSGFAGYGTAVVFDGHNYKTQMLLGNYGDNRLAIRPLDPSTGTWATSWELLGTTHGIATLNADIFQSGEISWIKMGRLVIVNISDLVYKPNLSARHQDVYAYNLPPSAKHNVNIIYARNRNLGNNRIAVVPASTGDTSSNLINWYDDFTTDAGDSYFGTFSYYTDFDYVS